jgi:hypothetical protein
MRNRSVRSFVLLLTILLLAACATFDRREMALIQQSGVSPAVVHKIERGDPLTPSDLVELTQHGVPNSFLSRYLNDQGVDYLVTRADVSRMRRAGVSAAVIDALLEECDHFARHYASPAYDGGYGIWWTESIGFGPSFYFGW